MNPVIKTVLYLGLLSVLLMGVGVIIGGFEGLTIAFVFSLLMNVFAYFFSDKMALMMHRAKEIPVKDNPKLHSMVESLAKNAGIPKPKIYLVNNDSPNAFATGRNPENAVIAVTSGILSLLNEEELKGVIAHELAHIKNKDILIASIAGVIAGTIGYIAFMARWSMIFGGGNNRNGAGIIGLLVLAIIVPIIAVLIQMAISRSREFVADETGSRFAGSSDGLINALQKLHLGVQKKPMNNANQGTAHMFIINPFSGKSVVSFFATHPPLEERIKRLQSLKI